MRCWVETRWVGWVDRVRERKKWGELERFFEIFDGYVFFFSVFIFTMTLYMPISSYN